MYLELVIRWWRNRRHGRRHGRDEGHFRYGEPGPVRPDYLADSSRCSGRSRKDRRSSVTVRAFRLYLAGEGADILDILRGRDALAAGDVHDLDDVINEIEAIMRGKVA